MQWGNTQRECVTDKTSRFFSSQSTLQLTDSNIPNIKYFYLRVEGPSIWQLPSRHVQGSAKRLLPGMVNFVPVLAYHFCLSLPAALMQPNATWPKPFSPNPVLIYNPRDMPHNTLLTLGTITSLPRCSGGVRRAIVPPSLSLGQNLFRSLVRGREGPSCSVAFGTAPSLRTYNST